MPPVLDLIMSRLRSRGKQAFLLTLPTGARVFDIGCGNDSPFRFKRLRPDLHYVGLDIGDYNQKHAANGIADEYVLCKPESFADEIERRPQAFDAIVSAHNLEHCFEPERVLRAMFRAVRRGGRIYLSFPSEASLRLPSRKGTLNFYDDPTHREVPRLDGVMQMCHREGIQIDFCAKRYRPIPLALVGLMLEPVGLLMKRNMPAASTWALYGFETVIWASRP